MNLSRLAPHIILIELKILSLKAQFEKAKQGSQERTLFLSSLILQKYCTHCLSLPLKMTGETIT